MATTHAKLGASKFEQVMLCPGSLPMQANKPRTSSKYAAEGTAAHQVLTWAAQEERPAAAYHGRLVEADGFSFEVDDEMVEAVQVCLDYLAAAKGDDGLMLVDQRVHYGDYIGAGDDGQGTADVIIIRGTELIVVDYKHGRGVEVDAERNPQMSLYALGALAAVQPLGVDIERIRLVISQPHVNKRPSEWDCSVEDLVKWARITAHEAVLSARNAEATYTGRPHDEWIETFLKPGEKQCKFCQAKAECPALRNEVAYQVAAVTPATPDEFAELVTPSTDFAVAHADYISVALSKVDMIEDWCKAIRAEAERRLLAGDEVPGFKVVAGKKGARQWVDVKAAEEALKTYRLKVEEMYDLSLISPTTAEKLTKKVDENGKPIIGPRQWPKLQGLIRQSEGKPHVAPVSDPRPALDIKPVADEFEAAEPGGEFA